MAILPDQPALVGRDRERQLLLEAVERAVEGLGGLVLLSGEAGIGKTSLLDDLTQRVAENDLLILSGAAYEVTATPPYGPWAEVILAFPEDPELTAVPDQLRVGGGMAGIDSQAAFFELSTRFLTSVAAVRPLLILLEDLHWADPASLDLLRHLSRTLSDEPVLMIATYRDDEITPDHHLFTLLPAMIREGRVERLHLQRLEQEAVSRLVRERYRLPAADEARLMDYLERLAEGNPFFINELLFTLVDRQILSPVAGGWELGDLRGSGVSTLIQQVINGRLARIDAASRGLLEIAAVIGYDVQLDLLQELHEGSDAALDETLQQTLDHHLLVMSGRQPSARFSHALVRQTIYEAIPPLRRQSLHQRVGDLLADRPRPMLSTVANHLYEAGDERSIDWLVRSAEQAHSLFAPQTVISHASRGIELANRLDGEDPLDLYRLCGLARESLGDFDGARSDHEFVLERARERGNQHAEWQALLDLGALWASRDYQRTYEYCEQAIELARGFANRAALGHSLNRLGNWHSNADRASNAVLLHQEALELFEELDDKSGIANTLELLGTAYYIDGNHEQSFQHYAWAIPLLREKDDRQPLCFALATAAGVTGGDWCSRATLWQQFSDSFDTGPLQAVEEAHEIASDMGWRAGEAYASIYLGGYLITRGALRRSIRLLEAGQIIVEEIQHRLWRTLLQLRLGCLYLEILNPGRAQAHFERAVEISSAISARTFHRGAVALTALALAHQNRVDQAEQLLSEHIDLNQWPDTMTLRLVWYVHARVLVMRGEPESALHVIDRVIDSLPGVEGVVSPYMGRLRGEILLACDRVEEAKQELDVAQRAATTFGGVVVLWRIHALQRKLYLTQGRLEVADEAGKAALEIIDELADQLDDEELRATFLTNAQTQISTTLPYRPDRETTYAGLTPRELEVLQAVAGGLTDAEAGERLYIATRTVSQHLRSVYNKLGVNNRAAAVRIAVEQGLV